VIDVPHVLAVLEQEVPAAKGYPAGSLWVARSVSADRLRNRIETVLSWCAARGHRPKGLNPAAWSSNLEHILPKPSRVTRVKPFAAVPYSELPALLAQLKTREGVAVKALLFTIMTAARSGETLGATFGEVNFRDATWTISPERMKSRKEHRVPLSPQALALLKDLPREEGNPHLFIGARNAALGEAAMSATLKRLGRSETVHGFRSAFSTWAHEQSAHSAHTIEMCLAHAVGSEVEKAYRRTDLFEKRRKLMEQWARYVTSPRQARSQERPATGAVVPLRKGAQA
jgi:integrase